MIIDFDKNQVEIISFGLKSLADKTVLHSENSQKALKILYDEGHQDFQYDSINKGVFEINKKMQQYSLALQGFAGHLQNLINAIEPYLNFFGAEVSEKHAVLDSSVLRDCANTLSHFLEAVNNKLTEFEKSLEFRKSRANNIIERFKAEKDAAQKEVDYAQKEVNYTSSNLSSCESNVYDIEVEHTNSDGSISSHTETVYPDCSYEQGCLDDANDELDRKIDILDAIAEKCNRAFEIYSEFEAVETTYFESKNRLMVILSKYQDANDVLNSILNKIHTFETTNFNVDSDGRGLASKEYLNSNGVNKLISENPVGLDITKMNSLSNIGHDHIWEKDGKKYVQIRNKSPEIYAKNIREFENTSESWKNQMLKLGFSDDDLLFENKEGNQANKWLQNRKLLNQLSPELLSQGKNLKKLRDLIENGHFYEHNTELLPLNEILLNERLIKLNDEYNSTFKSVQNNTNQDLGELEKQIKNNSAIIGDYYEESDDTFVMKKITVNGISYELGVNYVNRFKINSQQGECRLWSLYLPNEIQGKGVGSALVSKIEEIAKSKGQDKITGIADNPESKKFFQKLGYEFPNDGRTFIKKL